VQSFHSSLASSAAVGGTVAGKAPEVTGFTEVLPAVRRIKAPMGATNRILIPLKDWSKLQLIFISMTNGVYFTKVLPALIVC